MPAEVIDIDDGRRIWKSAVVQCSVCTYEWRGCYVSDGPWECPACHVMAGTVFSVEMENTSAREILRRYPLEKK